MLTSGFFRLRAFFTKGRLRAALKKDYLLAACEEMIFFLIGVFFVLFFLGLGIGDCVWLIVGIR